MLTKKIKLLGSLSALILSMFTLPAQALDESQFNVDKLLKYANLWRLTGALLPLNLGAQLSNPEASTKNVSDFNDFFVLTVPHNIPETRIVEFDKNQKVLNKIVYDAPWMGVQKYSQLEIPARSAQDRHEVSLQEGLDKVKACMAKQGESIPDEITGVIIYKTQLSRQIIYDYVFKDPNSCSKICEEILYVPSKDECERPGMLVSCHRDFSNPIQKQNANF